MHSHINKNNTKVLTLGGPPEDQSYESTVFAVAYIPPELLNNAAGTANIAGIPNLEYTLFCVGEEGDRLEEYKDMLLTMHYDSNAIRILLEDMPPEFFQKYCDKHHGTEVPLIPQKLDWVQLGWACRYGIHHKAVTMYHAHLIAETMNIEHFVVSVYWKATTS